MHVAYHACIEQFLASCQRIAISHSRLIRPHVIRRACHLLSHRHRLHMLDILHASTTRLNSALQAGMARWCSLTSTNTTIFNKASCLSCRWTAGLYCPHLLCLITFFFFFSLSGGVRNWMEIYTQGLQHTCAPNLSYHLTSIRLRAFRLVASSYHTSVPFLIISYLLMYIVYPTAIYFELFSAASTLQPVSCSFL